MDFRTLRRRAKLSAYRLAQLSGVQQTTISQLDLGKVRDPRWSTIAALAATLNTTPGVVAKAIENTKPHRTHRRAA